METSCKLLRGSTVEGKTRRVRPMLLYNIRPGHCCLVMPFSTLNRTGPNDEGRWLKRAFLHQERLWRFTDDNDDDDNDDGDENDGGDDDEYDDEE